MKNVFVFIFAIMSISCVAQDLSEFEKHMNLAKKGNVNSQIEIGFYYKMGVNGAPKDISEAIKWLKKASLQGNASAQFFLAQCYDDEKNGKLNYSEAAKWYTKAAMKGNPRASWRLGDLYAKGLGVPKDINKAVIWYRKAAEKDKTQMALLGKFLINNKRYKEGVDCCLSAAKNGEDLVAPMLLGQCYEYGLGVTPNKEEAIKWYSITASNYNYSEAYKAIERLKE